MPRHPAQRQPHPRALQGRGTLKSQPRNLRAEPPCRRVWKEVHGQRVLVKVYPLVHYPEA